jgi:chaperone modulatory protein CbpM
MATDRDDELWLYAQRQVSIVELSESCGLSEAELRELVESGALTPADPQASAWAFSADSIVTVRRAVRIRDDLELDAAALALVLTFLERINSLEAEVRHLTAQLAAPRR